MSYNIFFSIKCKYRDTITLSENHLNNKRNFFHDINDINHRKQRQKPLPPTQRYMIAYFLGLVQLLLKWRDKTNCMKHIFMSYVTENSQHGDHLANYENVFVIGLYGRMTFKLWKQFPITILQSITHCCQIINIYFKYTSSFPRRPLIYLNVYH